MTNPQSTIVMFGIFDELLMSLSRVRNIGLNDPTLLCESVSRTMYNVVKLVSEYYGGHMAAL